MRPGPSGSASSTRPACWPPPSPGGHHWRAGGGLPLAAGTRRRIKDALRESERRYAAAGVRCHVHDDVGIPSVQILAWSRRSDLVLLGRRTPVVNGSGTLEVVLRECPRRVAVPVETAGGDAAVLAYDGSLQASRAIYAFVASGLGLARPVHVVTVDRSEVEASHSAGMAAEYLKSHDIDAHPCPVATELAPAAVILEKDRQLDAGLLVMGAYGESALREFFLGSVTRTTLRESRAPVFCFH